MLHREAGTLTGQAQLQEAIQQSEEVIKINRKKNLEERKAIQDRFNDLLNLHLAELADVMKTVSSENLKTTVNDIIVAVCKSNEDAEFKTEQLISVVKTVVQSVKVLTNPQDFTEAEINKINKDIYNYSGEGKKKNPLWLSIMGGLTILSLAVTIIGMLGVLPCLFIPSVPAIDILGCGVFPAFLVAITAAGVYCTYDKSHQPDSYARRCEVEKKISLFQSTRNNLLVETKPTEHTPLLGRTR